MTVKDRVIELCAMRGITVQQLEQELSFGNGTIGYWNKGAPTLSKLVPVADFFGVSIDFLIGRELKNPATDGDGNNDAIIELTKLDEDQIALIRSVLRLNPRQRSAFRAFAETLVAGE